MATAIALKLLLLLLAANGAPVLARYLFGQRGAWPIDRDYRLGDGQPLFGASKTWRGLLAAGLVTPPLAVLLALPATTGLALAAAAMAGDLLSSFVKRRLRIPTSGMAFGLDQLPEALLPLLVVGPGLGLGPADAVLLSLVFLVLELVLSRLLYHLHIRRRPY
ncbi:MAG: CDP-archaeol synthase [Gammaproteobacteria bacterium]